MPLPVVVPGWEIECCLEPPSVGDLVEWPLQFVERENPEGAPDPTLVALQAVATPLPDWEGATEERWPVRLDLPGGSFYWDAPKEVEAGPVELRGYLLLVRHGDAPDDFPETTGIVRRVQVSATRYAQSEPGVSFWPSIDPPDVHYRDVPTAPSWFDHDLSETRDRLDDGVLVDLELI